jgi:hypothetical protein
VRLLGLCKLLLELVLVRLLRSNMLLLALGGRGASSGGCSVGHIDGGFSGSAETERGGGVEARVRVRELAESGVRKRRRKMRRRL